MLSARAFRQRAGSSTWLVRTLRGWDGSWLGFGLGEGTSYMWWDGVIVGRGGGHRVPQTPPARMLEQMDGGMNQGEG